MQLALNYTSTSVTTTANSTTVYVNSNDSGTTYDTQQLARVVGKCDLQPPRSLLHACRCASITCSIIVVPALYDKEPGKMCDASLTLLACTRNHVPVSLLSEWTTRPVVVPLCS